MRIGKPFREWEAEQLKKYPGLKFRIKLVGVMMWFETRLVYRPWRWIGVRYGWLDDEDWGRGV